MTENFDGISGGKPWWQLDFESIARLLGTDLSRGISSSIASQRLARYGPNQLREKKTRGPFSILLEQLYDFIVWVLLGAALVSSLLKEWIDAAAIGAIVMLNAVLGFVQEFRAERSLAALKKLASPNSKVVRDGQLRVIRSDELVVGDLVELEAGDNVPCDCRVVFHTPNFATLEASLTGESNPVLKTSSALIERDVPLADRANMVYMGTSVVAGRARAVAIGTGMDTELGSIAGMIQEVGRETTPLQRRLERFGRSLVYLCLVLVAVVFALGLLRGGKLLEMFLTSVSLAVAAIPEGLPAVVTIALAVGVHRMVKRNALMRKLPAVETLGSATVVCTDKTGTLTRNEMTVQAIFAGGRLFRVTGVGYEPKGNFLLDDVPADTSRYTDLKVALQCGVLCNGAQLAEEEGRYAIVGDPTEGALLTVAAKAGMTKNDLETEFPFVEEIPFDSERKKMTVVRKEGNLFHVFVKGAPDILLGDCVSRGEEGTVRPLNEEDRLRIAQVNNDLANQALRVLALGYRVLDRAPARYEAALIEKDLTFLGLVAMIDPPREEVKGAIATCATAGIRTIMITGDHKNTAVAVARELGLFEKDSIAVTGEELERMSERELFEQVKKIAVYARVSPAHKLKVVRAWKQHGGVVAMTGDGVNDAPAVKEADIGVAMGITGTDVTREVADLVVLDDNFASIVAAVEEGRIIYTNIRKFIHYLLSCNAGEVLVMFTASVAGLPVPLLPVQILLMNLVTDGLPALALGVDPVEDNVMKRPPRPVNEPIITGRRGKLIFYQGSVIAACSLLAFALDFFLRRQALDHARSMTFVVLACAQLFHSFNMRSLSRSLFRVGVFGNRKLVLAVIASFLVVIAVVYLPFLQMVFKTEALGLRDWGIVVAISSLPLWAMETYKQFNKRGGTGYA